MRAAHRLVWFNLLPLWKKRIPVWGNRMQAVTLDRLLYLFLHSLRLMGSRDKAFLSGRIRPGMFVVDVGANLGLYTLLMSGLAGKSGGVVALEPDPDLFAALQTNCDTNSADNVRLFNLAAGAGSGATVLHRSLVNAGDNRIAGGPPSVLRRTVNVRVTSLDELLGGQRVDFIKIDVQGWERQVLQGMTQILAGNPNVELCLEFWPSGLRRAGSDPIELLETLDLLRFRLYETSKSRPIPAAEFARFTESVGDRYTNIQAIRDATAGAGEAPRR